MILVFFCIRARVRADRRCLQLPSLLDVGVVVVLTAVELGRNRCASCIERGRTIVQTHVRFVVAPICFHTREVWHDLRTAHLIATLAPRHNREKVLNRVDAAEARQILDMSLEESTN